MKVCMLVRNPYVHDSRVRKEAHAVAEAGHAVTVVAVADPENRLPAEQWEGPVRVLRIPVGNLLGEWRRRQRERARRADKRIRRLLRRPRALVASAWRGIARLRADGAPPPSRVMFYPAAVFFFLGCLLGLLTLWWIPLLLLVPRVLLRAVRALLDSRLLRALRKTEACRILSHYVRLRRTVFALRADVYHAHNLDTVRLAVAAARRNRSAVVYDSHELEYGRYAPTWTAFDHWFMRREERLLVPRIDAMITVNEPIARWLAARYRREVIVVNNSSALEGRSRSAEEVGDWRERLGLGERKMIAYVGSLIPGRGLPVMLDVMERLGGSDYVFCLFGPQRALEDGRTYGQMVEQRGLTDRIVLAGAIPEDHILATLAQADCSIVLTEDRGLSHRLALPNKLFQSALARVPLVTSSMPGLVELTRRYRLGLSANGEDPTAIADAIRQICARGEQFAKDDSLLERLAADHGWPTNRRRLLALYARLARSRGQ